jgi:hypothetical protein
MNFLESALKYAAAGLKVIPFSNRPDGSKSFPLDYAKYREAQTEADVRVLFAGNSDGICLLCTDGIEAIDIDVKHDPAGRVVDQLIAALDEFQFPMTGVIQNTKSGGKHIIYRCPQPEGNKKLASRRGEKEAMIETRGKGGLLFVAPTPGYEIVTGDLLSIPTATQEHRDQLIRICRHLHEPEPEAFVDNCKPEARQLGGKTPWDDYDAKTDILQMLLGYGWKVVSKAGNYVRLNRPGAKHDKGIDGSVIIDGNYFYPFTSSTEFNPNKGYGPSSVYAIMEHRGNFSAAAKALYQKGYGDRIDKAAEIKQQLPDLISRVEATRYDINAIVREPKALLKFYADGRTYPVAGRGMMGIYTGQEKSGKSFIASCHAASAVSRGREVLNFTMDLDGGKMLWFDNEQSGFFYHKTQARVHRVAGVEHNTDHYRAYHLRPLSARERVEVIEYYIYNTPGVSVVMIDGFVDLAEDYNDLKEMQSLVNRIMKWSDDKQVLILGVLHLNKGDGKIRGHLGSELKNKCDFIINTLKSDNNRYQISNPTCRYPEFPPMEFSRDEEGLPVYKSATPEFISTQFPNQSPQPGPATSPVPRGGYDAPF